ncbi:hypothetical protein MBLNU459_g7028t1 [Dothideomycetes sp. NU459]
MSDALCGPSNAFQQFQKHTAVDRTLQQDRLVSRQSPAQAFRSHDPNAGLLDPEFEAFQAGQPPAAAFAAPQFPLLEPLNRFQTPPTRYAPGPGPGPSYAAPAQAPAWASDFQQQQLSPPPASAHHAPQARNQHWDRLFHQSGSGGPAQTHPVQRPALQYRTPPPFAMTQQFGGQFQHSHVPPQAQHAHMDQGSRMDQFDDAAFERAFDAAMDDVLHEQHQPDETTQATSADESPFALHLYPHLPVLRIALLKAALDGSDRSLHDAALLIHELRQHDMAHIDPVQAMLLQPVLYRLADTTRSPFAQRYGDRLKLATLNDDITAVAARASIDPTSEELLAAYADSLWGRNQSNNHLQRADQDAAEDNIWRERFRYDVEKMTQRHVSDAILERIHLGDVYNMADPENILRVLNLEIEDFAHRHGYGDTAYYSPMDPTSIRANLFAMTQTARAEPELIEAIGEPLDLTESALNERDAQNTALRSSMATTRHAQASLAEQQAGQTEEAQARVETLLSEHFEDMHHPHPQQDEMEQEQQQEQQEQSQREDDELAQTAAELLTKISDNTTVKFKNSAFLGLMRKLADREVRVEGDKMVETGKLAPDSESGGHPNASPSTFQPTRVPAETSSAAASNTYTAPRDGQEVVDLLNQPGSLDQDADMLPHRNDLRDNDAINDGSDGPGRLAYKPALGLSAGCFFRRDMGLEVLV